MKETVGNVQYASLLYDFYGGLLREKQLEIMNLYHEDNLSLSEIAEDLGMSRQAVHYTLKKAEASLEKYEEVLGLIKRYEENSSRATEVTERVNSVIDMIEGLCGSEENGRHLEAVASLKEVTRIVDEIVEEQ